MAQADERDLVHRCIAGEEEAWRLLVRRYGGFAERTVRYTLRMYTFPVREDVVEEIVFAVYESLLADGCRPLRQFRGESPLKDWLIAVARRQTARWVRTQIRREAQAVREQQRLRPEPPDPQEVLSEQERSDRVASALQQLPERERRALEEVYFQERSYREAAGRLGVPLNTFAAWVGKAKRRLLQILDDLRLPLL